MTGNLRYHHIKLLVANPLQVASYYCVHLGFAPWGIRRPQSHYQSTAYAIKLNEIIFVFDSLSTPRKFDLEDPLVKHGDAVKDIAFQVDHFETVVHYALERGAQTVKPVWIDSDHDGFVKCATIKTVGTTTHTLLDCSQYSGTFLPHFLHPTDQPNLVRLLARLDEASPVINVERIDHVATNDTSLDTVSAWYERILNFHRFWSPSPIVIDTGVTALRIGSFATENHQVKVVISEPYQSANGKQTVSQIQEYLTFNGGSGVQHIAFYTTDIVASVQALKQRGTEFLSIPPVYYDLLGNRLEKCGIHIEEDMELIKANNILIDCDAEGYLLQIFTKPLQDRPTLFLELIQRHNHDGFGAANIKTLFRAIEIDQNARGNLAKRNE